jgi:hypothetical protein
MRIRAAIIAVVALISLSPLVASGPLGLYAIVEKVAFEPNEAQAERLQVWGAFAFADGGGANAYGFSNAARGYVYFQMPGGASPERMTLVRREWADLKSVAGTGQAVGFGSWGYIGAFAGLDPAKKKTGYPPYILESAPRGGEQTDLRVRPASEQPSAPASYQTDSGVVKISANGPRADIVKELQNALKK